jgi:hypothetical protein
VVPFQICVWDYSDPCNMFPTLHFDVFVDTFFMVPQILIASASHATVQQKLLVLSSLRGFWMTAATHFCTCPLVLILLPDTVPSTTNPLPQLEVASQFFIAYYDANGTYVDDFASVFSKYCLSIENFCFDTVTSLPWSYLDVLAYMVLLQL